MRLLLEEKRKGEEKRGGMEMRCGGDCGELVVGSVSSRADINYSDAT